MACNVPNLNGATFYKFFLLPHCTSEIEVPTEFVKTKGETLQAKIKLKTDVEVGKWWTVETARVGRKYCCFREGWTKFVEDVGLIHRDTLVFTYLGNSAFHVSVYGGVSRCKKLPCPPTTAASFGDENSGNSKKMKVEITETVGEETILRCRIEVKKYHHRFSKSSGMYIAKDFAVSAGIARNRNIVLVNGAGKEWAVSVTGRRGYGYSFTGGLKKFLVDNNVAVGTTITFEFHPNSPNIVKALW